MSSIPISSAAGLCRLHRMRRTGWTAASAPPASTRAPSISRTGVDFSNTVTHTAFLEAARSAGRRPDPAPATVRRHAGRMTVLSPTAFPAPIAPRSARRGCAMISSATFGAAENPDRGGRCPIAMSTPSARKASTAASSRWTGATSARAPPPTTSSTRPSISIRRAAIGLGWENDVRTNTGDAGAFRHHRSRPGTTVST